MNFKGKKAFCFLALKHHSRFLLPITRHLEKLGMRVIYLTAPAEMPFELTLKDEGLPFNHTQDYLDASLANAVDQAYRQVRSVWREKVLDNSILHHFPLPVQDKVLRMHTDNFYLFRRMFEVEKPDLVLALHELNSWGKMLGYLSHEFHVPMITLQEGLYYAPAAVYRFHTEYSSACLAWGEATKEILTRCGGSAEKIIVVGNTHLQTVIERHGERAAIKRTKKELAIAKEQKVVTLLMGGLGYDRGFEFPAELLNWLRTDPRIILICKWHPQTNRLALESIANKTKSIQNIQMLQHFDTYRLLAASDLCVVFGNSTTGLEALAFGKPLVEVQLSGLDYSFASQGVAEPISSLGKIPRTVGQIFTSGLPQDRQDNVAAYLRRNLHLMDGRSVERCVGVIEQMLSAREDTRNPPAISQEISSEKFLCSIIIPVSSGGGAETLVGVAENTSAAVTYECLLSRAAGEDARDDLAGMVGGDVRMVIAGTPKTASLCNAAAAEAQGKYLCFLDPGWVPQSGWLEALLQAMESSPHVGIVGGMSLRPDGLVEHAGIALDANLTPARLYHLLPATLPAVHRSREIRAVMGCLLIRREAFVAAGGFDEGYQGDWCELDICLASKSAGWRTIYAPESLFFSLKTPQTANAEDRVRFFAKWVGELWPDQDAYWAEDEMDSNKLSELYRASINDSDHSSASVAI